MMRPTQLKRPLAEVTDRLPAFDFFDLVSLSALWQVVALPWCASWCA
ncbi:MAG: hypothetical protein SNJ57_08495 [Cyanobacteriota bacterium]